jgi:glycosyltransferase involved in cell wall biosynthesis
MAAGLPIVSTRLSGVLEVAPEDRVGWYCRPESYEDLATSMRSAALDPKLADSGEIAHQLAASFSSESTWRQYEALFAEFLERKKERRSLALQTGA